MTEPANCIAALGGYVYARVADDDSMVVCAVKAITKEGVAAASKVGEGDSGGGEQAVLEFEGPFNLDTIALGDKLASAGSHPAGEDVMDPDRASSLADGSDWEHGAFIYLYENCFMDCYFRVKGGGGSVAGSPALPDDAASRGTTSTPPAAATALLTGEMVLKAEIAHLEERLRHALDEKESALRLAYEVAAQHKSSIAVARLQRGVILSRISQPGGGSGRQSAADAPAADAS
eukprot:6415361-Prymnesium_polylepis.1